LVREPKVFLFDEPLSNLDAKLRVETRIEIKRLHQRLGTTIVYVTHDQIEAMTLASRIAIMKDGMVQQYATPTEIYERPANTYVGGFIGAPPMNFIPGRVQEMQGKLVVAVEGGHLLPLAAPSAAMGAWKDRDVTLGIRPEALSLAGASEAEIESIIDVVEPTGADTLAYLALGDRTIVARLKPRDVERAGVRLRLAVDMSRASLFDPLTGNRIG
jgi:multiple sugar transport system ATP-binding protein